MDQFEIGEVCAGVYKIEEMWFAEHANLYLVKGNDSCLLFDCGLGIFDLKRFLENRFKNIRVVLTHSHFDHAIGMRHFLPEDVLVLPKIFKNLQDRKMWALKYLKPEYFGRQALAEFGLPCAEKLCAQYNFYVAEYYATQFAKIEAPPFCFEVIELPGHSDDSTAYYDRQNGILVTGDALYDGKIYFDLPNSDKEDFKKSLERIGGLDFNLLLQGHNLGIMQRAEALSVIKRWKKDLER